MKIVIETIPHSKQRYPTVGDWWWEGKGKNETLQMRISNMHNWRYEAAVAYHELREALLCKSNNISQKQVDQFDIAFENNRQPHDTSEPGDDPSAPYYVPHQLATRDEILLIHDLGEDWEEYEKTINSL